MSIEKLIEANTKAIEKLTAAVEAMQGGVVDAKEEAKPKATKKAKKKEAVEEVAEEPKPEATKKPAAKKKKAADKPTELPNEIKDLIKRTAKDLGRDVAVKLLGQFNVKTAGELKPEQYDDFIEAGNALFNDGEVELDDDDLDELVA